MNSTSEQRLPLLKVVSVGLADHREFRDVRNSLQKWTELHEFLDLNSLLEMFESPESPPVDLLVLLQRYPGEFSVELLEKVRAKIPICPIINVLGSWCEGEIRTGTPLPGTVRIYSHQWGKTAELELNAMENRLSCSWTLPVTSGEEERFLFRKFPIERSMDHDPASIFLAILETPHLSGYDPEMNAFLSELFTRCGYFSIRTKREKIYPKPTGIVWDVGIPNPFERTLKELRILRAEYPDVKIVLLCESPRIDEKKRLLEAGADVLCSKPLDLDELLEEVRN